MEFYSKTSYEKIRQPEGILKNWFWKYEQSGENYRVKRYIPWGNEAWIIFSWAIFEHPFVTIISSNFPHQSAEDYQTNLRKLPNTPKLDSI